MFLTSLKAKNDITDDGHHVVGLPAGSMLALGEAGGGGGAGAGKRKQPKPPNQPGRRAKRNAQFQAQAAEVERLRGVIKKKGKGGKKGDGKKSGKGGRSEEDCFKWTKDEVGCVNPCPNGRKHPCCPRCGGNHPWRAACPV